MVSKSFVDSILDEVIGLFSNKNVQDTVEEIAEKGKNAAIDLVVDIIPLPLPKTLLKQVARGVVDTTIKFVQTEDTIPVAKTLSRFAFREK
jgi:hypothetical protein